MQIKLLPTLWVLGGVLYAGSTIFLAETLLGGGGKQMQAANVQCEKTGATAAAADPAKTAAVAPANEANSKPTEKDAQAQPEAKPDAAKPDETAHAAPPVPDADDADQDQAADQGGPSGEQNGDQDQAALDQQDQQGADQQDGGGQDQAGSQPEANEGDGEWARVVAGTADMRAEPSLQSQLVYALPAGWQVRVISRQPGWVQVQDANSGASGWVDASAIAPVQTPSQQYGGQGPGPGYAPGPGYQPGYPPPPPGYGYPPGRYAQEGYPPDPRWQRRERRGEFSDFLRRALGGF